MRTMLTYLRTGLTERAGALAGLTVVPSIEAGLALHEDVRDDLVERRVLHAHVDDRVLPEDRREHVRDPAAFDAQAHHGALSARHLAKARQLRRRHRPIELQ